MALTKIKADGLTADLIDETKLADNSIDSEHYNDGSIDEAHIADDAVTADKLANAINTDIAAKAVLTGSTNNTITTVTGANAIQGESGLTFDGSTMNLTAASGDARLTLIGTEGNDARITLSADDGDDHIDQYNIRSNADDNSLSIDQFESGSFVERVTVANGGNVGIGTTSPGGFKLRVEGGDSDEGLHIHTGNSSSQWLIRAEDNAAVQRFVVKADGEVVIGDGNLVIGTSGHGIDFSVNAHASAMSSELFGDYEEGTFTPTIGGWSASGTGTYNGQNGKYTKIGNMVTIWISMAWTNLTSASGVLAIESLPFSANGGGSWGSACPIFMENVDLDDNTTVSVIGHQWQASSSSILLYGVRDNTSWYGIGIDTSGGVNLTCTYPTTA